jgi:hypothetical protein
LALLGVIDRPTRDLDILDPQLPDDIACAARDFAIAQTSLGAVLARDWLNNGPIQLGDVLPPGWKSRLQVLFSGSALRLMTLGRSDLLCSKLFALCDRGTDFADCLALAPTEAELGAILPWLTEQDANPMWPEHVRSTLERLQRKLSHAL